MRSVPHSVVTAILDCDVELRQITDDALRARFDSARRRAITGEPLDSILPETFALAREAADRALGIRPHPQQLHGAIILARGGIAEMATGEGKTLTATLPLALYALKQRGAHLATANDYLAQRDAAWMRPVYERLGLSVGSLAASSTPADRRRAYRCDITYAAAREFGFDFLRDRLQSAEGQGGTSATRLQRDLHYVLVDEADSILLDEARTPLLISAAAEDWTPSEQALFAWSATAAAKLHPGDDFSDIDRHGRVRLTPAGRKSVRTGAKPESINDCHLNDIYESVERAVYARERLRRDRDYVIRDREVVIVDEFTGRLGEGRHWTRGVHQAVEAQEQLPPTPADGPAARITVQDLFLRYPLRAGMSGTASEDRREFRRVYQLSVHVVPSHRPVRRTTLPPRIFAETGSKLAAVVAEVAELQAAGRPVLIGTRSIDKSERLSRLLQQAGIEHSVLNAQREAEEAEIVKRAGEHRRVTVATNMAGRGTDIKLQSGVAELGGLHVIGTEMHESARIDRQLFGRCARQGDPGTCRQFVALDDELLAAGWGARRAEQIAAQFPTGSEAPPSMLTVFLIAQRRVQKRHRQARRQLLRTERAQQKIAEQLGFDYYLDLFED